MHNTASLFFLIVVCLVFIGLFFYLWFYLAFDYIESVYAKFYGKPLYTHFYLLKKTLPPDHAKILDANFTFYRNLSEKQKRYFRHRVAGFINKYEFHGREGIALTDYIKVNIAATWVMLTFGTRYYLPDIFRHIVIYPSTYCSNTTGLWHKGEFNHPAEAVVFSWKHFSDGLEQGSAHINIGVHEFANVLQILTAKTDESGVFGNIYAEKYDNVISYLSIEKNIIKLTALLRLREHPPINAHELVAAALVAFFETPAELREKLPELYNTVCKMTNLKPVY